MAATPARLMTVEEFRALPEDSGGVYHELRHGEVAAVTRPKLKHSLIQKKLCQLLEDIADPDAYVDGEMSFQPLPEHELWVANVAYLSAERFRKADTEDNIHGAPDLVVEVLSPSNTAAEILDREQLCLGTGCREFWVIDPVRGYIRVTTSTGEVRTYRSGDQIPLPLFGTATLPVDEILS